jgi:hypothetical protein
VEIRHEEEPSEVDRDAWEGSFWEVEDPFPVEAALRIRYVDAEGKRTERTVAVRQLGIGSTCNLIIGHCQLRKATRTFRLDRIHHCIDTETGEIITDVHAHLRAKYEQSPAFARDKLLDEEFDTLRVLFYVGKADGQLRAAEKAIIREACRALASDSRITDEMIDDLFKSLEVPTANAFKLAIGRLSKKPREAQTAIVDATKRIIATQTSVHAAEAEALDYMLKRFSIAESVLQES